MNQIPIVHISSVTAYAQLFLDEVIQPVCTGQRQYLADLTAKPQSDTAESAYEILRKTNQPFVRQLLCKDFPNHLMRNAVEELAEVEQQNIASRSILLIVPAKMNAEPPDSEVVSFVLDGRAVIINKRPAQNRYQCKVAQTALNNPLVEVDASNVPQLSAFHQAKLIKACASEGSVHQLLPRPFDV